MAVVRISDPLHERLEALAKTTHRSKSFYLNKALKEFLEDFEDYLLASERLDNLRQGKSRTYSLEEMAERFDLPVP